MFEVRSVGFIGAMELDPLREMILEYKCTCRVALKMIKIVLIS